MEYNAKNYMAQGGDQLVIGGSLEILEGASVTGLPLAAVVAATEETLGGVLAAAKTENAHFRYLFSSGNRMCPLAGARGTIS